MTDKKNSHYEWQKKNTKIYSLRVFKNTEEEIFQKLESVQNVNGYIKDLIKKDIAK